MKIIKTADIKSKFAVSVPKKEIKTAVQRNLLKRRALSILRKIASKTNPQFNSVFFLKKGALDLSYSKLEDELVYLLKKARIV